MDEDTRKRMKTNKETDRIRFPFRCKNEIFFFSIFTNRNTKNFNESKLKVRAAHHVHISAVDCKKKAHHTDEMQTQESFELETFSTTLAQENIFICISNRMV